MKKFYVQKPVLVAVLLLIIAACKDEQMVTPPINTAIQGQFVTSDGSPLANIIVEATDATGKTFSTFTTDAEGNFEIQNLPESNDNAVVSFINDNEVMQQLKLSTIVRLASEDNLSASNKSKKVTVFLGGEYDYDASFAVIVVDKTTQERVQGTVVTMATSENAELNATSDADGVALFEKIVPGRYTVRIFKDGYNFYEESMLLVFPEGMDKIEFEFEITPADGQEPEECCHNSVAISVLYANGKPVAEQQVSLHIEGKDNRVAYTNAHGVATFTEVCTGVYEACTEYATENNTKEKYCVPVRVGCQDSVTAIIRLDAEHKPNPDPEECCNNTIVVEAYYSTGGPAKDQPVYLHNIHTGTVITKNTDNRGRVEFFELCSGSYVASNSKEHKDKDNQIVVTCNDRKATGLELKKEETGDELCCNNTLIIHLTAKDGKPIGLGVEIIVIDRNTGKELVFTKTDTMSTIAIHNMCKGTTFLNIEVHSGDAVYHILGKDFAAVEFTDCKQNKDITVQMNIEPDAGTICCDGVANLNFATSKHLGGISKWGEIIKNGKIKIWDNTGMNVKNGYITGCNSADNQPGDTVFAKVFGICEGEYQGVITIPGCGTEHRFHFTIDCNAQITKEFEITCE